MQEYVWKNPSNSVGYKITVHHYSGAENYSIWIDGPDGYGSWRQGLTKLQALSFVKGEIRVPSRTFSYILSQGIFRKILDLIYGTILIPKVPNSVSVIEIKS